MKDPATRLGPIPDALRAVGDDRALEAWWDATCTNASPAQIAGRAEAMAELIERDPAAALADMQGCVDRPLDLDWLADFAARCCKQAASVSDAQSFWLLADQLKLHCEQQHAPRVEQLNLAVDFDHGDPIQTFYTDLFTTPAATKLAEAWVTERELGFELSGQDVKSLAELFERIGRLVKADTEARVKAALEKAA